MTSWISVGAGRELALTRRWKLPLRGLGVDGVEVASTAIIMLSLPSDKSETRRGAGAVVFITKGEEGGGGGGGAPTWVGGSFCDVEPWLFVPKVDPIEASSSGYSLRTESTNGEGFKTESLCCRGSDPSLTEVLQSTCGCCASPRSPSSTPTATKVSGSEVELSKWGDASSCIGSSSDQSIMSSILMLDSLWKRRLWVGMRLFIMVNDVRDTKKWEIEADGRLGVLLLG